MTNPNTNQPVDVHGDGTPTDPYRVGPPQRKWSPPLWMTALAAVLAFILGLSIAAMAYASGNATAAPVPTVTTTTPGPTVTETATVTQTPKACLQALDLADKGFGYAVEVLETVPDALDAVANLDFDTLDETTSKISEVNDEMNGLGDRYNAAKAECRSSGT